MTLTEHPQVAVDSYVVRPACYDEMGNSDRDMFCLAVTNGHAWGWSIRQHGFSGSRALSRKGEWIYESRGSGHNKARRWPLEEALTIALQHIDTLRINGSTAADCAARWPVDTTPTTTHAEDTEATTKESDRG